MAQSGHELVHCTCLLLTQSGHPTIYAVANVCNEPRYRTPARLWVLTQVLRWRLPTRGQRKLKRAALRGIPSRPYVAAVLLDNRPADR